LANTVALACVGSTFLSVHDTVAELPTVTVTGTFVSKEMTWR